MSENRWKHYHEIDGFYSEVNLNNIKHLASNIGEDFLEKFTVAKPKSFTDFILRRWRRQKSQDYLTEGKVVDVNNKLIFDEFCEIAKSAFYIKSDETGSYIEDEAEVALVAMALFFQTIKNRESQVSFNKDVLSGVYKHFVDKMVEIRESQVGSIDANNKPADKILEKALAVIKNLSGKRQETSYASVNKEAALKAIPNHKNMANFSDDFFKKNFILSQGHSNFEDIDQPKKGLEVSDAAAERFVPSYEKPEREMF